MSGAGDLRERTSFDQPRLESDGAGGEARGFVERFTVWSQYTHLRGSEAVMQARLAGRHTVVVRVRSNARTRAIGLDWRARDSLSGVSYNIRDITPTTDRAFIDLLCESGVAN